jgi:hypothetical protein
VLAQRYFQDLSAHFKAAMSISPNTIFVTGVPTEFANRDGSPTLRLEINHLKRDVRQWSLYIQALSR